MGAGVIRRGRRRAHPEASHVAFPVRRTCRVGSVCGTVHVSSTGTFSSQISIVLFYCSSCGGRIAHLLSGKGRMEAHLEPVDKE